MNKIIQDRENSQANIDIFNWISIDMIPTILKKLSWEHKVQQRDYLSRTITNLYEGTTRDTMEQKILSLSLDWYLERKDSLNKNYKGELILSAQLKTYYSISFLNWIYDKQKKITVELYNMERAEDISITIDIESIIKRMEKEEMYNVITNYIVKDATDAERFIYDTLLGLQEIKWSDTNRNTTSNYPGGMVSMKTFYNHRTILMEKLKTITTNYVAEKNTDSVVSVVQ